MTDEERALMELHDGELSGEANARVAARVESDPALRAELARIRLIGELVRGAHAERLPSVDLADAIVRRALAEKAPREAAPVRRTRWERFAPAGAVLAMAAVVCLFVASYRGTTGEGSGPIAAAPAGSPNAALGGPSTPDSSSPEPSEAGVSIQTVDFGSTQGAIFQVSAGSTETMVVWTLEDANDKG